MKKYIYQKFLLNCDYEKLNLEDYLYQDDIRLVQYMGTPRNLLDYNVPVVRKIELSNLDDIIDTEDEWSEFLRQCSDVDLLVVLNGECNDVTNPIIERYREVTLKSYICRLQAEGVGVAITNIGGANNTLYFKLYRQDYSRGRSNHLIPV